LSANNGQLFDFTKWDFLKSNTLEKNNSKPLLHYDVKALYYAVYLQKFLIHYILMKNRKLLYTTVCVFIAINVLQSCNYFTYTPHSKKQRLFERPSAAICDKIVDFRIAEGGWPISKQDFMNKGLKYYEVIKKFPYQTIEFKIKDSTEMIFYFRDNIKDIEHYKKTKKRDLNSFNGNIHFWKENEKFLWKINMK
jgi:hypothetical protein